MDGADTIRHEWTPERVEAFKEAFYEFCRYVKINSKEKGPIRLGEHLYRAQLRFLDFVFDGLSHDKHDFKHMKSRQLGVSTITRALGIFWLGIHDGLKGYCILDTNPHKEEARLELIDMINSLPASYKFPRIKRENRDIIILENGSQISFAVAGTKETKSSGNLGRGSGVNMVIASEMCSWVGYENVVSFKNSLATTFPDRLYIWESTGRGPGLWDDMWEEAKADTNHQCALFTGFWAREDQIIPRNDPDFERYGRQVPTPAEAKKINQVKEWYGWQITPEQLAWVRRYLDPLAKTEGDTPAEFEGDVTKVREQAWTEKDSALMVDSTFFHPEAISEIADKWASNDFKAYSFSAGVEFTDLKVYKALNAASVELKVWEEPENEAVYVVAGDVAHGTNENNDRSSITVMRCYADGMDQVAEYASPLVTTQQYAWIVMALAAWYAGDTADVYLIVELNGPGMAVWDEIRDLRRNLQNGYQSRYIAEQGLTNIFRNVKNYFYSRPDSMAAGKAWHWKTSPGPGPSGKVRLMERCRDFVGNGMLHIRSIATLKEMESMTRVGDTIEAPGSKKDDRAVAVALSVQCWEQRARRNLSINKRTRDNEAKKRRLSITDKASLFHTNQLQTFFAAKKIQSNRSQRVLSRRAWRGR